MSDDSLSYLTTLERPDSREPHETTLAKLSVLIRANALWWLSLYESRVVSDERKKRVRELVERVQAGESVSDEDLPLAAELLYYTGSHREAVSVGLTLPLYSTFKEYEINAPSPWTVPPPHRPVAPRRRWALLGQTIDFPIGVPASALTGNAEWIGLLADSGYNVITFKTVRTREWAAFAEPNWVFVSDAVEPFEPSSFETPKVVHGSVDGWTPADFAGWNTANSFGVPSPSPDVWQGQVSAAITRLSEGQLLIVSVMGADYEDSRNPQILADDYAAAAKLAYDAGARFIELNLSCPNTLSGDKIQPPLCNDHGLVKQIVDRVRAEVGSGIKLVLKLSYQQYADLKSLVDAVGSSADGYSGINTVQCQVKTSTGDSVFPGRDKAGVSGRVIHKLAADFVTSLARIRSEGNHSFDILGMGGVTTAEAFVELYNAGATAVQAASGVFLDLFLGYKCIDKFGAELSAVPPVNDELVRQNLAAVIRAVLARAGGRLDLFTLSSALPVPALQVLEVLDHMEQNSQVRRLSDESELLRYALEA